MPYLSCRLRAFIVCFAILAVAGCVFKNPGSAPHAESRLRLIEASEPRALNPIFNDLVEPVVEINNLYNDPLWGRNERGELVPRLAERVPTVANGGISADGRTLTVRLRHGVTWQDGVPFTSADVRFSWQAVMDPHNNVGSLDGFDQVAAIETPDPYIAVVHLRKRYARAIPGAFPPLIPEHLLRNVQLNSASFNGTPIGTGPFKVVSWKRGESIDLVANDAYYLGKPKLRKIRVLFVPDMGTRAVMLKTGEADLAYLDRDAYRQIYGSTNVAFAVAPTRSVSMFFLNVTRPRLRDVRVRTAIAHALDRAAIIKSSAFAQAVGTLANGYADPSSFAYDRTLAPIAYDPKRAAELLDAAGWRIGGDGIRVKNGNRLTLQLVDRAGATSQKAINVLAQAMLHAVGVEAEIKTYSSEVVFAQAAANGVLATGKFDVFFGEYNNPFDPDSSWILTCARAEPNGYNESRYCNHELDRIEAAALDTYDLDRRRRYYARIDRIVANAVPIVFVAWPKTVYGMNPRLKGFAFNGFSATWNAYQWSL